MKIPPLSLRFAVLFACVCALNAAQPPYRVLYSNDTTHISSSPSPFKPEPAGFQEEFLRASISEAKGADTVQMLQPGLGWVPWWKSEHFPMEKHAAFLATVGHRLNGYENYVLRGGDMIAVLLDECKKINRAAFVSIRMNDTHHVMRGNRAKNPEDKERMMSEFALFVEHPEARVDMSKTTKIEQQPYAMDWASPFVREHKYRLLEEICKNYDIDGLELDFMRQWVMFNPDRTSEKERTDIITEFVASIRKALDDNAPNGKHRWLCVRVPGYLWTQKQAGIDLKRLADVGVDMFNIAGHYNTDFQIETQQAKKIVGPNKFVYAEAHFAHARGPKSPGGPDYLKRNTPIQFYTFAHVQYARGIDGVSFFNFPYYRGTHSPTDVPGEPAEPPFEVLEHIGDPQWVARQPQQYVLGALRNQPRRDTPRPFEKKMKAGQAETLMLDMAPPAQGWKLDGKLRIQSRESLQGCEFEVRLNGRKLTATADVSNPLPDPYSVAQGDPEDYRAWIVPQTAPKNGINTIEIKQTKGAPAPLFYLDISFDVP